MKIILYLFLLLVFSSLLFYILSTVFNTVNPLTDFLLSILVVHFIICNIEKYRYEVREK